MTVKELDALLARIVAVEARLAVLEQGGGTAPFHAKRVATEDELSGDDGDPTIKYIPRNYKGDKSLFMGKRYSQCTPQFLDFMAKFFDWAAEEEDKDPNKRRFADDSRNNAAKARGWAKCLRAGWKPTPVATADSWAAPDGEGNDASFPFGANVADQSPKQTQDEAEGW